MNNRILEIIKLYTTITGRQIIPAGTPPENTYQWRYAAKFVKNMEELDVDWEVSKQIAYFAIKHALENKVDHRTTWTRGLWILTRKDIIELADDKYHKCKELANSELVKVKKNYDFAKKNHFKFGDSVNDGLPNIVMWYNSNYIGLTYIAMSEGCRLALAQLDRTVVNLLPSHETIKDKRIKCIIDKDLYKKLKRIMMEDFIVLGV
jgi:hypothetical protein